MQGRPPTARSDREECVRHVSGASGMQTPCDHSGRAVRHLGRHVRTRPKIPGERPTWMVDRTRRAEDPAAPPTTGPPNCSVISDRRGRSDTWSSVSFAGGRSGMALMILTATRHGSPVTLTGTVGTSLTRAFTTPGPRPRPSPPSTRRSFRPEHIRERSRHRCFRSCPEHPPLQAVTRSLSPRATVSAPPSAAQSRSPSKHPRRDLWVDLRQLTFLPVSAH
ncbi:hypothetical protein MLGJGCBP_00189 [Rhodococcus sp. T7]|nr:hypothetical protein MLGJGCBP_00189 [Rhodococcus sp. T7]